MEPIALISLVVASCVALMASIHTSRIYERHLFAWISGATAIKFGLLITGFLENENGRYTFDTWFSLVLSAFALISLMKEWFPKFNPFFTQRRRSRA